MSIYEQDEREMPGKESIAIDSTTLPKQETNSKWEESDRGVWIPESVVYLIGEIADYTLFDFMTRIRTVIRERDEQYGAN
mgnify:CR=1 FL=1